MVVTHTVLTGSIKVIREAELDGKKKYIFGFHPHGIIVLSRLATYGGHWENYFPGIVTRGACDLRAFSCVANHRSEEWKLTTTHCEYQRWARRPCSTSRSAASCASGKEFLMFVCMRFKEAKMEARDGTDGVLTDCCTRSSGGRLGGVDASRSTADKVFKAGNSIVVYPGGVPEIFMVDPNSTVNELVLHKRLGFVKLAIRHGAELVPSFVFGEKYLYKCVAPDA